MIVRRLSEEVINRIAAGEVVERPASVVKELLENSIDAEASRIEVVTGGGGAALIRVTDDGTGMVQDDLLLSVERHCTSKLADDLLDIATLGFRGEALASIGSVARLSIATRHASEPHGWEVTVDRGALAPVRPAALARGTRVEVADLFHATPARLKFLKSERAEAMAVTDIVKRLAMAHPEIRFDLTGTDRTALAYPTRNGPAARLERLADVLGRDFAPNAVPIEAEREGARLAGFAALPTFNRASPRDQYLFVNGRPVRDRLLLGAVRGAYADVLARDRHALVALFLDIDPHEVDVNVHPTKAEVRFRDPGLVRGLIVGALKEGLAAVGQRASPTIGSATLAAFRPPPRAPMSARGGDWRRSPWRPAEVSPSPALTLADGEPGGFGEPSQPPLMDVPPAADARASAIDDPGTRQLPLGAARAQTP